MNNDASQIGLYDPSFEHDACGVGLICSIKGEATHEIVRNGIQMLLNMEHRGACGCDPRTGDGAGILMQIPHAFLTAMSIDAGFSLPRQGAYGVAMLFIPPTDHERARCFGVFEEVVRSEGLRLLGWRLVPTDDAKVGEAALALKPDIWQAVLAPADADMPQDEIERRLYMARRQAEKRIWEDDGGLPPRFHVASMSTRTVVYKGMLTVDQLRAFYPDLSDGRMTSAVALVHSRFSTNTFPNWSLAQPFRFLCHNGEINTLRGNVHWMKSREALFTSPDFGDDLHKILPVLTEGGSDSQVLDNALELLAATGRSIPRAMTMLVPEAWERHETMSRERKAYYAFQGCLIEPWDGPATIPFTDGRYVGAMLDRNGLRPSRYTVTKDGFVVISSEAGALPIDPANILEKGRLQPGRMFLVDMHQQRIIPDEEIKTELSRRKPYLRWIEENMLWLKDLPVASDPPPRIADLASRQRLYGYTIEERKLLLAPMAQNGKEAIGSMGKDTPLAVLSDQERPLFDYFKQLFAQVTNPPLDAIREELITSLATNLGRRGNLFKETPDQARLVRLEHPVLTNEALCQLSSIDDDRLRAYRLPILFDADGGGPALNAALDVLCAHASQAVDEGCALLILTDRDAGPHMAPIPALLATGAVHHGLLRAGKRTRCSLIVESGEPREPHHLCVLIGYGAGAVNPYLALDTVAEMAEKDLLGGVSAEEAMRNYVRAAGKGILKVMSKMGISTVRSYCGAQIFEAVGLDRHIVDAHFTGTVSRIGGIGLDVIAEEARRRHAAAYSGVHVDGTLTLPVGGRYQWRRGGERHSYDPENIARLQQAVRGNDAHAYTRYARTNEDDTARSATLRGMLALAEDRATSIPLDGVEPWTDIVKRFKTGAMSYGSISREAHETLAEAMNHIGGKSNTGEGGEDPDRYSRDNPRRSRIKQVASGRFGVTISYLASADEIQIKMAQGAKPGEGGQLPAKKVYPWIAKTRYSTPYVGLISPPPHHDIYSIEDLAQLIFDLKNANAKARISVKLVSEAGVGTVAAGVAKGKADVVLISGYDGGTGASPQTSIMHAGLPWELGLAETHQTLVRNGLRDRIKVECDGQLKTGRDVAIAAMLGADEFGFATAPLVALGCIMMRKCHLNTCPVGIATQDPELRKMFAGRPEHVVNYFHFVAEELRSIMARLGFRKLDDMVGRVDLLRQRTDIDHWKARTLDLRALLAPASLPEHLVAFTADKQDHSLDDVLDHHLVDRAAPALENGESVEIEVQISNVNRTLGTLLSNAVVNRHGIGGLPDDTINVLALGSAGQSCGAFLAPGISIRIEGEANDYFGKGLSGGRLVVVPPPGATFVPNKNIIIGNVALYGATHGDVYINGQAGERFAVRNSGVHAVVEGIGDHGCEYMTGGRVVVLGPTGRNFAAGMSGGIAYVLDGTWDFRNRYRCNNEMVEISHLSEPADIAEVRGMIERHRALTDSDVAAWALENWDQAVSEFVKVLPIEYKNALLRTAHQHHAGDGSVHEAVVLKH